MEKGTFEIKVGLAEMLKGGVIMDVTNAEQAKIAEDAGAVAVMALERIPADIRKDGGIARMSDPELIQGIQKTVSIPVMAKCRIGHFAEAQILQSLEIDFIDESEVLTPADENNHIYKHDFKAPFVCGARNLGEALRRIGEGAAMIRTKGEAGTGNVVAAMRHARLLQAEIAAVQASNNLEPIASKMVDKFFVLDEEAKENLGESAGYNAFQKSRTEIESEILEILVEIKKLGRLPVVTFTAGGIATPADAALMMQFGMDGIFVGSGIFKSDDPDTMAKAVVETTAHFDDPELVGNISKGLGNAMAGLEESQLETKMASRGH